MVLPCVTPFSYFKVLMETMIHLMVKVEPLRTPSTPGMVAMYILMMMKTGLWQLSVRLRPSPDQRLVPQIKYLFPSSKIFQSWFADNFLDNII